MNTKTYSIYFSIQNLAINTKIVRIAHTGNHIKNTQASELSTPKLEYLYKYVCYRLFPIVCQLVGLELANEVEVLLHLSLSIVHIDIE